MTETGAHPTPNSASLFRGTGQAAAYPQLDQVAGNFARSLRDLIGDYGLFDIELPEAKCSIVPLSEIVGAEHNLHALCRYRLNPMKSAALMLLPAHLMRLLIDSYFGGLGESENERPDFTHGEMRFIRGFSEKCCSVLSTAWSDYLDITASLDLTVSDWAEAKFLRHSDLVIAQTFRIRLDNTSTAHEVVMLYSADALNTFGQRAAAEPAPSNDLNDFVWQQQLSSAVLQTRLSLRAIFARPELAVSKLLSLQEGDVIPLALPRRVPVEIGGIRFAQASVGEANGNIAIQIEELEGMLHD